MMFDDVWWCLMMFVPKLETPGVDNPDHSCPAPAEFLWKLTIDMYRQLVLIPCRLVQPGCNIFRRDLVKKLAQSLANSPQILPQECPPSAVFSHFLKHVQQSVQTISDFMQCLPGTSHPSRSQTQPIAWVHTTKHYKSFIAAERPKHGGFDPRIADCHERAAKRLIAGGTPARYVYTHDHLRIAKTCN